MSRSTVKLRNKNTLVLGFAPVGLTEETAVKVAEEIGRKVKNYAQVRSVRFLPSTKVNLSKGGFQILASTTIDLPGSVKRSRTIESMATINEAPRQSVQKVEFSVPIEILAS